MGELLLAPAIRAERIARDLDALARFGADPSGGVTRPAFSPADAEARAHLVGLMREEARLEVRVDAAGNIFGRREGTERGAPAVLSGSHLDSVVQGGKFDGTLGVAAALEAARAMEEAGLRTRCAYEVVVFSNEEPSPWGTSCLGSRAFAGLLEVELLRQLRDPEGKPLFEALRAFGLEPEKLSSAAREAGTVAAYVELHVEQGTRLERAAVPIGVVTHIAGIDRFRALIEGRAAHAGTVPMDERQDALVAAAEAVLAVERAGRSQLSRGTTATAGQIQAWPNALNVVPARVELGFEVRGVDPKSKERARREVLERLSALTERRGVGVSVQNLSSSEPAAMGEGVMAAVEEASRALGLASLRLASGAGHDAALVARVARAGMIFVPSRGGVSHSPEEWTGPEHVEAGARVLAEVVAALAEPI
ncbi:MAG: M20 family metallo-hydrolase [Nitrospinota bacterium]